MTLKYRYREFVFIIINFLCFISCFFDSSKDALGYALAFGILTIVFSMSLIFRKYSLKVLRKKVMSNGVKKQGYIIDSWGSVGLQGKVDNEVFIILEFRGKGTLKDFFGRYEFADGLVRNKAYKYICSELRNMDYKFNSVSRTERFPIDVYFYKNRYYFDLDSVDLGDFNEVKI